VLAKRADLRWRRTPEQLAALAALQDELLDAAAAFVRPGGLLLYSTCSIEADEGPDRVAAFLARPAGAAFALEAPPPGLLPAAVVVAAGGGGGGGGGAALAGGGWMQTLPHVHGVDGAFAARLRRGG
jgi:16S rRNA (cytosine967-C5)-methyltransferase